MEVRRSFRQCSALLAFPLLLSMALPAAENSSGNISTNEPILLAGPIGKSSSASARVTLVIPPRPAPASQLKSETADQKQTVQTKQNTGENNPEN